MAEFREREGAPDVSADLVRRIQAGDRGAWEGLYARYHDRLLFTIRARLGPDLRARLQSEDVLASVVLAALQDLDRFEHRGPGSLAHWLHACAVNKIRSKAEYHRALKRDGAVPLSPELLAGLAARADEPPRYVDAARWEALERALRRLPDAMREVVLLRTVEGLSNADAAAVLGKSPDAASKLYNRALARLALEVPGEEGS